MRRPVTVTLPVRRLVRPVGAAVVASAVLTLGACQVTNPQQTQAPYLPSDGVGTLIGSVQAMGMVVVAQSKGATGVLTGSILNRGNDPVRVTFLTAAQAQAGATTDAGVNTVELRGNQQQQIAGVQFPELPSAPGALAGIVLRTTAGEQYVSVPVLPPDGYYSTYTATSAPATTVPAPVVTSGSPAATTGAPPGSATSVTQQQTPSPTGT